VRVSIDDISTTAIFLGKFWIRDSRVLSTGWRLGDLSSCKVHGAKPLRRLAYRNAKRRHERSRSNFCLISEYSEYRSVWLIFITRSCIRVKLRYRVIVSEVLIVRAESRQERRKCARRLSPRTSGTSHNGAPFRRAFHANLICHRRGFMPLKEEHLGEFRAPLCPLHPDGSSPFRVCAVLLMRPDLRAEV